MEDLNDKITGDAFIAFDWNQVPSELQEIITSSGQIPTSANLTQVARGIATHISNGHFYYENNRPNK